MATSIAAPASSADRENAHMNAKIIPLAIAAAGLLAASLPVLADAEHRG